MLGVPIYFERECIFRDPIKKVHERSGFLRVLRVKTESTERNLVIKRINLFGTLK